MERPKVHNFAEWNFYVDETKTKPATRIPRLYIQQIALHIYTGVIFHHQNVYMNQNYPHHFLPTLNTEEIINSNRYKFSEYS